MEKAPKSKGTIVLKYLQKAATFTISNNPHSPRTAAGERVPPSKGLSGPIKSIIPTEARHKKRSEKTFDGEPTSPKVTCIGQIKHRKTTPAKQRKKPNFPSGLSRILSHRVSPDHKEAEVKEKKTTTKKKKKKEIATEKFVASPAPALGQLKKFSSRRESLADFDWETAAPATAAPATAAEEEEEEEEDFEEGKEDLRNFYHSAPLVLGGDVMAAEHKEIGIWRRRSVAALVPLRVNK